MAPALAVVGIGLSAIGGVVGAFGNIAAGKAQAGMYDYQAGMAKINADIARKNADYAIAAGETRAQEEAMKTRAVIGETRAKQGASGLDVNVGSAVDVRASEAEIGDLNVGIIRSNAQREAYGYQVEASQYEAQSELDRYAAKNAKLASYYGAASSVLGGASSVATKWSQAQNAGMFS